MNTTPVPVHPQGTPSRSTAGSGLKVLDELQRPFVEAHVDLSEELWKLMRFGPFEASRVEHSWARQKDKPEWASQEIIGADKLVGNAYEVVGELPTTADLQRMVATLEATASAPAHHNQAKMLVALMLSGFPSSWAPDPGAHIEWLVHEALAGEYSPLVIAKAVTEVVRTSKNPPTVEAFLSACQGARKDVESRVAMLERHRRHREAADGVLALFNAPEGQLRCPGCGETVPETSEGQLRCEPCDEIVKRRMADEARWNDGDRDTRA